MSYTNRHGVEFSPVLVELARISPQSFAAAIKARNQWAADKLEGYLKEGEDGYETSETLYAGCPHCFDKPNGGFACGDCAWVIAHKRLGLEPPRQTVPCCYVEFPSGHAHAASFLSYSQDCVCVYHHQPLLRMTPEERVAALQRALKCAEDHVDWAALPCWGEDVQVMADADDMWEKGYNEDGTLKED